MIEGQDKNVHSCKVYRSFSECMCMHCSLVGVAGWRDGRLRGGGDEESWEHEMFPAKFISWGHNFSILKVKKWGTFGDDLIFASPYLFGEFTTTKNIFRGVRFLFSEACRPKRL